MQFFGFVKANSMHNKMSKAYENSHSNIIGFSNDPILTLVSKTPTPVSEIPTPVNTLNDINSVELYHVVVE